MRATTTVEADFLAVVRLWRHGHEPRAAGRSGTDRPRAEESSR
jgi:hypothetical protein